MKKLQITLMAGFLMLTAGAAKADNYMECDYAPWLCEEIIPVEDAHVFHNSYARVRDTCYEILRVDVVDHTQCLEWAVSMGGEPNTEEYCASKWGDEVPFSECYNGAHGINPPEPVLIGDPDEPGQEPPTWNGPIAEIDEIGDPSMIDGLAQSGGEVDILSDVEEVFDIPL